MIKLNVLLCALIGLLTATAVGQSKTNDDVKGKWFFGAELGLNTITSLNPSPANSLQGGILAQYYLSNHISLSGRIKYFKTGVSNNQNSSKGYFNGAVLSVPYNVNFEFKLFPKVNSTFQLGIALNQEIKSTYNYPPNSNTNYSTFYGSFNPGIGISYRLSPTTVLYLNYEAFVLGNDRDDADWLQIIPNSPNNSIANIGLKHNFFSNLSS